MHTPAGGVRFIVLAAALSVAAGLGGAPSVGAQPRPADSLTEGVTTPSVLILNSYHPGLQWSDDIMTGMIEVLDSRYPGIEPVIEYMDSKRHFDGLEGRFVQDIRRGLRLRYERDEFDLILASDDNALRFLRRHKQALFGETPVVFGGINHLEEAGPLDRSEYTGVREVTDLAETFDLALELYPDPPSILVITDRTTTSRTNRRKIEAILRSRIDPDRVRYAVDDPALTPARLERIVASVPPGGFIYYADFFRDNLGQAVPYERLLPRLSAAAQVPIFTQAAFYLGYGVLGGKVISGRVQGQRAAETALRVLAGESPRTIPVDRTSSSSFTFDYEQLRRFGIPRRTLPEGSRVVNTPDSPWYRYRRPIMGAVLLVILEGVLIGFLVWAIRRRRTVEAALRGSLEENRALLQEVHHRVKNNLQIISSMIHLGRKDGSVDAETFAKETENRIRALALMHESLYQSDSLASVNLVTYLKDLTSSVAASLSADRSAIRFAGTGESRQVPMDVAIPCGLIANELVTNAVKYGTPSDGTRPRIDIILEENGDGHMSMTVADNGPGHQESAANRFGTSRPAAGLGLTLVESLTRQLGGRVSFSNSSGFACTVTFPAGVSSGGTALAGTGAVDAGSNPRPY